MIRTFFIAFFVFINLPSFSQNIAGKIFFSDTSLIHASVSLCVKVTETGETVASYNSSLSLIPASLMKLVTTAAALELLGPQYAFKTTIGYTGTINKRSGILKGDIIISGGGDPALGSKYFTDHYQNFINSWVDEIRKLGIKKIEGRVITDDSYYDFLPIPSKWLFEDAGNYYGAGVYGLSAFDNTYEIHLQTFSDSSLAVIKYIIPSQCNYKLTNMLLSAGTKDNGYVYNVPYSEKGWLSGTIPSNRKDFVLKASVTDPPKLIAMMMTDQIKAAGISVSGDPSTVRLDHKAISEKIIPLDVVYSPRLSDIINVINHESVNLFAEHLLKELGKKYKNNGSTSSGLEVVKEFLINAGIKTDGMFIEDGSGLSPSNSINTQELVNLLIYMKNRGKYFSEYLSSLPDAGKEGTLKNYFMDPLFDNRLKAKSGSMTRVRSYAGYFTTLSGKNMVFSIVINNYTGPSINIITGIEEIVKEIINDN